MSRRELLVCLLVVCGVLSREEMRIAFKQHFQDAAVLNDFLDHAMGISNLPIGAPPITL